MDASPLSAGLPPQFLLLMLLGALGTAALPRGGVVGPEASSPFLRARFCHPDTPLKETRLRLVGSSSPFKPITYSAQACSEECWGDEGCWAWSWNRRNGECNKRDFYKETVDAEGWSTGFIGARFHDTVAAAVSCPVDPWFNVSLGGEAAGDPSSRPLTRDWKNCCHECALEPGCGL